jgi:hypothetical protein
MLCQELILVKVSPKLCAGAKHTDLVNRFLGEELLEDSIGNLEKPVDLYYVDLSEPLRIVVLHYLHEVSHELQVLVSSSHPCTINHHHELTVSHSIEVKIRNYSKDLRRALSS